MNTHKTAKFHSVFFALLLSLGCANAAAETRIAVLDFELKDLTLAPRIPAEIERTATVKPLLENELKNSGYTIVSIPGMLNFRRLQEPVICLITMMLPLNSPVNMGRIM